MRRGPQSSRVVRVVGYARVSSEEQARGTSLRDQQDAIERNAGARGLTVARVYVEAESAVHEKIERREQIRALLTDVQEGDLVLCDKLDRWSRDPEFTYTSIRQILERGAAFYAVSEQCDPSTKDGDTMLGFRILVAHEEHKRIKERTVGARKRLRDRGYYVEGLPPFGYRRRLPRGKRGLDKNILEVVPEQAALVVEAYRRCADGESIGDVRAWLVRATGRLTWDKKSIGHMLRNRVYLGEVADSRGAWIDGQHEAILDAGLFTRAQAGLAGRKLGGPKATDSSRTASWLVRGLAVCGACGARMGSSYGGGPRTGAREYTFYLRCLRRCGVKYVPVLEADAQVAAAVVARLESMTAELAAEPGRALPEPVLVDFVARRNALARKRERYLEAFADGHMSRDELRSALGRLDADRTGLDAKETAADVASPERRRALRRSVLAIAGKVREAWGDATQSQRRQMLGILATAVRLQRGAPPIVEWRTLNELAARTV
jgi:DNA invertase Pin-like site-specific DNA recombinase